MADDGFAAPAAGFRHALLKAAQEEHKAGRLTAWEMYRIRWISALRPRKIREAQDAVADQACAAGYMSAASDGDGVGFDWMALLDFIKELLPIILQIIAMF
jgi:hypothetical protein